MGNIPLVARRSAAGLLAAIVLIGAPALIEAGGGPVVEGFREVVFSVSDLDGAASFYREVAGWEVVHSGPGGSGLAGLWGLDSHLAIDEILLSNPGDDRGFLRLVRIPVAGRVQVRSSAQVWDTGGIFDVNVRVRNIHAKFEQLRERGWQFYSDPIRFSFGPFVVWEVLAKGPDGVVIAMVERVEPPLEGWPNLRELSHIFNSTQIVRDFEGSREFYEQVLGFEVYLEHEGPSKEPGPNVLGLPHNLAAEVSRKVVILSPDGTNSGSVELIAFDGLTGADFSSRAVPPNLGILALRFPVSDIEAFRARLAERGVAPVNGPSKVMIAPYGEVRIMTVRAPDGAWLEFYQPPDAGAAGVKED
jgi:catechol 2,3-dioxygenase-like lactoylglutathione lyase family enzyme